MIKSFAQLARTPLICTYPVSNQGKPVNNVPRIHSNSVQEDVHIEANAMVSS